MYQSWHQLAKKHFLWIHPFYLGWPVKEPSQTDLEHEQYPLNDQGIDEELLTVSKHEQKDDDEGMSMTPITIGTIEIMFTKTRVLEDLKKTPTTVCKSYTDDDVWQVGEKIIVRQLTVITTDYHGRNSTKAALILFDNVSMNFLVLNAHDVTILKNHAIQLRKMSVRIWNMFCSCKFPCTVIFKRNGIGAPGFGSLNKSDPKSRQIHVTHDCLDSLYELFSQFNRKFPCKCTLCLTFQ